MVMLLSGCHSRPPSINVLGAYFPDWLFCISGGCLTAAAIYMLLTKLKRKEWLSPYILTYPLLIAFFSMGYWILFFY
ncbi:YtcA family lipoprotein [Serratia ficaria]|uniref:YtcA family lipoprotein n=1 Tax=Serratia TaxID=613 RepID=UPI001A92D923|nr:MULTISPECIES: YtcA family lipoprotein [Serratia]MEE4482820.1 YtcA family lipoprotein [Serratia ficaria]